MAVAIEIDSALNMMAALITPIETPETKSGSIPASCKAW
jgi:hypothetical protein